ncbi:MAG: 2,3,4,5-tetrahydropyridine-2,6-dicarboxylate N-succinyltransferase [Pseudohongiellaceae bacterium]
MSSISLHSLGFGLATRNTGNEIIEVYYPQPWINPDPAMAGHIAELTAYQEGNEVIILNQTQVLNVEQKLKDTGFAAEGKLLQKLAMSGKSAQADHLASTHTVIVCLLARDSAPASVAEAYLKLHLLSHRLAKPNTLNLDGIFGLLPTIAWTNKGPVEIDDLATRQLEYRLGGEILTVFSVDKFPRMADYVIPKGVRIADTSRVRLGAHVGEGTTVMHEGQINFNAGTLGNAMIEGRISAGVVVGRNSDLGGGCSTMGTLSGGGKELNSIGENCLIGANAGVGIPLGDRCTVEAGLYVTAGTKVKVLDESHQTVKTMRARELKGLNDLLFRRNSLTGAVECIPNKAAISLNEALHGNN